MQLTERMRQLEQRQQCGQYLPPLPPIPPPQYDLPSLSNTDSDDDDDDEEEEHGRAIDWDETLEGYHQRQEPRRSTRYTTTTHHQGHARIDSDDDDCDGGAETAAGGDDIDWMDIQGDDEYVLIFLLFFSFWCFMQKGDKIRGVNNFSMPWSAAVLHVLFDECQSSLGGKFESRSKL